MIEKRNNFNVVIPLYNMINGQIAYSICMLITGLTASLYTYYPNIGLLYFNFGLNMLFCGTIDSVTSVWIVEMWQHNCGPYTQGLQFVLAVGSLITPLIANPFLSETTYQSVEVNITANGTTTLVDQIIPFTSPTRIQIPLLFVGGIIMACALIIGGLNFYHKYTPRVVEKSKNSPQGIHHKKASLCTRVTDRLAAELMPTKTILSLIVLSAFMIGFVTAIQWNYVAFWTEFGNLCGLQLNNQLANDMLSVMLGSYALSRALSIPMSYFLGPYVNIYYISQILFIIYSNTSVAVVWAANVLMGLGLGPIFAAVFQMVESITPMTNIIGVFVICYALVAIQTTVLSDSLNITITNMTNGELEGMAQCLEIRRQSVRQCMTDWAHNWPQKRAEGRPMVRMCCQNWAYFDCFKNGAQSECNITWEWHKLLDIYRDSGTVRMCTIIDYGSNSI
ncbi:unnamed protein product [Medioppia subpectinata]|uniref:Uncharacterized protein n=1 Tax=Medioppia subpectinata TaxID=1979941 RepID=A0A7R9KJW9_9ACAR|nr:unnamed protein product [Medioppia subpectinata]CAG2104910.1 unnamed protein product [Medioppia subpectinata]